ncbi:AraC family transcriptional regulator [Marinobacterium maritimum]|uniref:AraC family transcriptional regulator n=1 Tax=Marinobacterium maritimum TaxID=500162 RepID=A0ABN1I373_9GAMM
MSKPREQAEYKTVDELGGLEYLRAQYHRQTFSRHTHEGYCFGVITTGAQRFLRNGARHLAPQNSIILVNHDEVHDGHSATENGWAYQAIYPLSEQLAQVQREAGLPVKGSIYFPSPVVEDPELAGLFRLAFNHLDTSDNRLLRETLVYNTLLKLIQRHASIRPELQNPSAARARMELVRQFLDDQPEADISLEDLSRLSGVSVFHLIRQFQDCFGLPPHAYQIQARIRLAKRLIRAGESLAGTAVQAGFHDQSHLSRHFKKALGVTPGQFARFHQ